MKIIPQFARTALLATLGLGALLPYDQAVAQDPAAADYCAWLNPFAPASGTATGANAPAASQNGPAAPTGANAPPATQNSPGAATGANAPAPAQNGQGAPSRPPIPTIADLLFKQGVSPQDAVYQTLAARNPQTPEQLEDIYNGVYEIIVKSYIEPAELDERGVVAYRTKYRGHITNWKELDQAIVDLVAAVDDRWTWYHPVDLSPLINQDDNLVDFGVMLRKRVDDGRMQVDFVTPGSPAQEGGFREGDLIISVNGQMLSGLSSAADALKLLTNAPRSELLIKSVQNGKEVTDTYYLHAPEDDANKERAEVIAGNIAYIKLPSFMDEAVFQEMVGSLIKGAGKVPSGLQGIVLDLRYNPGGHVEWAKFLIRLLTERGVVLRERSRENGTEVQDTTLSIMPLPEVMKAGLSQAVLQLESDLKSLPLVILVNGSTASAAEMTASSLMETRGATLVGQRTFGKFSEMTVRKLPTCGELAVKSAIYLTPKGEWWQGVGILPQVVVEQPRPTIANPLPPDLQLASAINLLRNQTAWRAANLVTKSAASFGKILPPVPDKPLDKGGSIWKQEVAAFVEENWRFGSIAVLVLCLLLMLLLAMRYLNKSVPTT